MSKEMPHELSENQPPEWQGKPEPPNPLPAPEVSPQKEAIARLDFGGLLARIWDLLKSDWRGHFAWGFLISAGFSILALLLVSFGVQNLSDDAWALLNGQTLEISDEPTSAELEALLQVVLEVFSLVGWILPALVFGQLIIVGQSTKRAMNHSAYAANMQSIPWVKLITANLAVTLILIVMYAPMLVAFITSQVALGVLLLLIAIVFSIWFGIGIILLTPVVFDLRLGGIQAVRATLLRAKGHRLMIVGISLLIGILGSLLASTLTQFLSLLPNTSEALWYFVVTNFIPLALSLPLSAIAATVLYFNYKTGD